MGPSVRTLDICGPSLPASTSPGPSSTPTGATIGAAAAITRTGHIDIQGSPHEIFPVEAGDRGLRFRCRGHLDEAEPSRLPAVLILDDLDRRHRPKGLEGRPELEFCDI